MIGFNTEVEHNELFPKQGESQIKVSNNFLWISCICCVANAISMGALVILLYYKLKQYYETCSDVRPHYTFYSKNFPSFT